MKTLVIIVALFGLLVGHLAGETLVPPSSLAPNGRCYELRTYLTHPGKLEALHTRFRDHTVKLLEKHGMKVLGFWVPQDEAKGAQNTLVYLVEHPSREAAKTAWGAFQKDPEWISVRTESEKNGPIVIRVDSVFMSPTDYSNLK